MNSQSCIHPFPEKALLCFQLGSKINCVYLLLCKNSSRICGSDEVEFVGVALIVLAESQHTKREQKGRRPGFWGQKLMEPFVGCAPRLKKLFTSASQYSANSQTHIEQLSPAPICENKKLISHFMLGNLQLENFQDQINLTTRSTINSQSFRASRIALLHGKFLQIRKVFAASS